MHIFPPPLLHWLLCLGMGLGGHAHAERLLSCWQKENLTLDCRWIYLQHSALSVRHKHADSATDGSLCLRADSRLQSSNTYCVPTVASSNLLYNSPLQKGTQAIRHWLRRQPAVTSHGMSSSRKIHPFDNHKPAYVICTVLPQIRGGMEAARCRSILRDR